MKRLTILMLLLSSTNVLAEWTAVGGSADGELTSYVDFKTIHKKGNKVKMWTMYDFKTVQVTEDNRYFSSKSIYEYNCEDITYIKLEFDWYSGNMGNGVIVYSYTHKTKDYTPQEISPDSLLSEFFNIACGIK